MKLPLRSMFAGLPIAAAALALGCSNHILGVGNGGSTTGTGTVSPGCTGAACACGPTGVVETLSQVPPNKIDLLLVVDNSANMAYKQQLLAQAVPELVSGLVNPLCVAADGTPAPTQPASPTAPCPQGSERLFPPIMDMHVGLLSSSLGTFGADGCPEKPPGFCAGVTPNSISNDDHGQLVTRTDPCGTTNVPTYQNEGFLAWDPAQELNPPGTSMLSDLSTATTALVVGDGQDGCGFESQNESWYRFLVDPTPYQSISLVNNQVQVEGTDTALLAQRKAFLRPDSVLVIVDVSDETDTSLREYSSFPLFAAPELHLPHPSAGCHFDPNDPASATPNDPCCYSCGETPPSGCSADPACTTSPSYTLSDENTSLRAFGLISHKARYGIEFFYPPSRYVTALTSPTVTDVNGATHPNPVFSNLDPANYKGAVRDPSMIFYAPIVGVPWQLLARKNAQGVPDLVNGVSVIDPTQVGGFRTAAELSLTDPQGNILWDDIAGDPENYVLARSPFMVESTVPRSGTDPITGAAISPVTTPNGQGSMVGGTVLNDHERTIPVPAGDIEYACIFPLLQPIDCTQPGALCDCPGTAGTTTDNPVCQGTTQVNARAYPGIKELAIARAMGAQGIPGSICARQVSDATAADYGYRTAVAGIVNAVTQRLQGSCMPTPAPNGAAGCKIIEASSAAGAGCTCGAGRIPVPAADACFTNVIQSDTQAEGQSLDCFCEIAEATGADLTSCQTDADATATGNGWCYVDASANPASAPVVAKCPAEAKREVRFIGDGQPVPGSTIFLACP